MLRELVRRRAARVMWHLRNGSLWYAIKRKIKKSAKARRRPKGDQYYGHVAAEYLERRQKQDWWHREQDVMHDLLVRFASGTHVLDVPFGTGRFVPYYVEANMKVTGVDLSSEMLAAAEAALGDMFTRCDVRTGDATALPFGNGSFDLVVSFRFLDTIVGFADAKRALAEFARVSKSGAILELCERKHSAPRAYYPKDDEVMGGLLYAEEVEALLGDVGFRIVKKSDVIKDSGDWLMHAYLCQKSPPSS